nr:MAG TPA: Mitochondrial ribosomal protein L31 [Caudoviricetes sp.]
MRRERRFSLFLCSILFGGLLWKKTKKELLF